MHSQAMVHGNLKGVRFRILVTAQPPDALFIVIKANILIDQDRHARLADFGVLTIISDDTIATSSSTLKCGTTRWMSPELLDPDLLGLKDSRPTKESDCYALGMVVLEVLSGQPPFASYKDFIVMRKVIDGERPARPEGPERAWFTDRLWGLLEACWERTPGHRPTAEVALHCLMQVSRGPKSPSQEVGLDPSLAARLQSELLVERGDHGTGYGRDTVYRSVHFTSSQLLSLTADAAVDDSASVRTEGDLEHPTGSTDPSVNVPVTASLGVLPPPDDATAGALQPSTAHPTSSSSTLVDLEESACRRLISHSFSPHELPSLIEEIFTSKDEVKMIGSLGKDAAQSFIDVIHKVCPRWFVSV